MVLGKGVWLYQSKSTPSNLYSCKKLRRLLMNFERFALVETISLNTGCQIVPFCGGSNQLYPVVRSGGDLRR